MSRAEARWTSARSGHAAGAWRVVTALQDRLVDTLEGAGGRSFTPVSWLRDGGRHGGGVRLAAVDVPALQRASVNVSAVHYDDEPTRRLASATALSAIVHPAHPPAPSMHTHVSWTELRDGRGYWRVMGDLNPSTPVEADRAAFDAAIRDAAGAHYAHGAAQGDRYFAIPALDRHRGVSHFYLEGFTTGDWAADADYAERVGGAIIGAYGRILREALRRPVTADHHAVQLAYHTVYLFQVLTLDRGTTSGLLVHDQNDVGILGSLPARVDPGLLASWVDRVPAAQAPLVRRLADIVGPDGVVDDDTKRALASAVRAHYRAHPEALALQARGDVLPPTVANHR